MYVLYAQAFSPRDGGWVRWFGHFRSEEMAWLMVTKLWEMIVDAGDYETIEVRRTLTWRRRTGWNGQYVDAHEDRNMSG